MFSRRVLIGAPAVLALAACGPRASTMVSEDDSGGGVGGPFQLIDTEGRPVTEAILAGKWSVIYFGYTRCPGPCPTALMALKAGLDKMGGKGRSVQTILISLDPANDTPQTMKDYIDNDDFPKGLIGLTGTPEQVTAVTKAYKIYSRKTDEGLVDHQSLFYVMNPRGRLARPLTGEMPPAQIAAQIGDAMRQSG
jgi:protein SCO1/2